MMKPSIHELTGGRAVQYTTFEPQTRQKTKAVAPGERRTLIETSDTGIITRFWLTMPGWFWRHWDEKREVDPAVLRLTILRIYFDGSDEPSVEAPIGDFFGIGHMEYRHYMSDYLGMSSGGFYSYFPMPYQGGFRLEIENLHATETIDFFINMNARLVDTLPADAGRFHAAFHCGVNPALEPTEIANIEGCGQLVGVALSMQGEPLNTLSFLEAPEFIWIDGEEEPSIVGTGLEDFFNGGWYFRNGEFHGPLHGAPLKDALRSMVSMYRFLDADRIPFEKSLRMAFIYPWNDERLRPFIHSSTAYYYLSAVRRACYTLPGRAQLTNLYRVRDVDFQSMP